VTKLDFIYLTLARLVQSCSPKHNLICHQHGGNPSSHTLLLLMNSNVHLSFFQGKCKKLWYKHRIPLTLPVVHLMMNLPASQKHSKTIFQTCCSFSAALIHSPSATPCSVQQADIKGTNMTG